MQKRIFGRSGGLSLGLTLLAFCRITDACGAGPVVGWGLNDFGQTNSPPELSQVTAIAAGSRHSLALNRDGSIAGWGRNDSGELNVPSTASNATAIAAGRFVSLALRTDTTVVAWGGASSTNVPAGLSNVVALAAGWNHALALKDDGTVVAWGENSSDQTNVPAGLANVVAVAGGGAHNLALRADGTVAAFGNNTFGQTSVPGDLTEVISVAAGWRHSLALKADGTVAAWGYCGTGVPLDLANVIAIAAGDDFSLALKADGTVVAWGDNSSGQGAVPAGLPHIVGIAAGGKHSLALAGEACERVIPVTTRNDSGPGSLRRAIAEANANGGGTIPVTPLRGTIALTSGELLINNCVRIVGPGPADLSVSGSSSSRVFQIASNAVAEISGLSIVNGRGGTNGGGIFNAGQLTLNHCVVARNFAAPGPFVPMMFAPPPTAGGGVFNLGILVMSGCVVRSNSCGSGFDFQPGTDGGSGGGIYSDGELFLKDCTIAGNRCGNGGSGFPGMAGVGGSGGGLFSSGPVSMNSCTVSSNSCGDGGNGWKGEVSGPFSIAPYSGGVGGSGGGVFCSSSLSLTNCTIVGNSTGGGGRGGAGWFSWFGESGGRGGPGGNGGDGGGIHNAGTLNVCNSTLSENVTGQGGSGGPGGGSSSGIDGPPGSPGARGNGGGINGGGQLLNTLIANNNAAPSPDVSGVFDSLGFNLVGNPIGSGGLGSTGDLLNVDPQLGPLADNGGPTLTCAIPFGSPANNAGNWNGAPVLDQRGVPRSQRITVDIGAFEFTGSLPSISMMDDQVIQEDGATAVIPFTIGDVETPPASLIVTVSSSNSSLTPLESFAFDGSDGNRTLVVTPSPEQSGASLVAVTIFDADGNPATSSFLLTVTPVNDEPALDSITDLLIYEGSGTQMITLTGLSPGPGNDASQSLTVTAISSNPGLVPNPVVNHTSSEDSGTLSFAPLPNAAGSCIITVHVQDDGGTLDGGQDSFARTFQVTVLPKLRLMAGSAGGARLNEVVVPVRVTGFTGISSFQFSIHWNPSMADLVGVEEFGLPDLSADHFGTTQANDGTLTVAWDDPDASSKSLADGAALFAIRFLLRGDWGTTNSVIIDGIPTAVEAVNSALALVPVESAAGQLSIPPSASLAGLISNAAADRPVSGVTLKLSANLSATSDDGGGYLLGEIPPGGDYFLTPAKTNDTAAAKGVTGTDITLIRRHVLGISPLGSARKMLAADVSGSRSVSTLDIAWMRRLILGITNAFPAGLWRFTPSDYVFLDPENPWDAPTNRAYSGLEGNLLHQDFLAIKLGDVNDSWAPPGEGEGVGAPTHVAKNSQAIGATSNLGFHLSRHMAQPGETLTVRVTTRGFQNVSSAQFTLEWDPAVLRYEDITPGIDGMAGDNFGTNAADSGRLAFSWDDDAAAGVTIADGTSLFAISFTVTGGVGSDSALTLTDSIAVREVGIGTTAVPFETENGRVSVEMPRLTQPAYSQGGFQVVVPTVSGRRYVLEFSDFLPASMWTALPAVIGDGGSLTLIDPAATHHQRFYRVRVE